MSPTHDTVILDVDGTLADTNYLHTLAWARAFARVDLHPPMWQLHRAIGMGGDKLVAAVAGDGAEQEHGDALREAWEEEYAELLPEVRLLPGARDLVLALADRGLTVVLASSGKEQFTQHVLDLLDLPEGALAAQASSDEAEESKPEPDVLEVALDKVGEGSALLVGDTPYDVAAAAKVGAPCAAVLTGGFGDEELSRAGAVIVVDSPAALVDLPSQTWADLLHAVPPEHAATTFSPLPDPPSKAGSGS
ncbi:HAD family hydrolase [Ornithinimicrobium sufpigmenti]|uniref:HAD family hydrolase n=1 Tax=Ornithinimicrobium sufpigmenti TaxID=2508882 RepID=UPI001035FB02|nr:MULTISPECIES: HAD family hydrolase [unclassified Ornithinimicrobium]